MKNSIENLVKAIPSSCHSKQCNKDQCSVGLKGAPINRVIIDMDCEDLGLNNQKHCDYLILGKTDKKIWVTVIELKGGKVGHITSLIDQLRGGANLAEKILPSSLDIQFYPVLAHKKSIHRIDLKKLRKQRVKLRKNSSMVEIIRCGDSLSKVVNFG